MERITRTGLRRHLSLLVSGGLVLLIGLLGLVAGHSAGAQAREVHRADRIGLQETLAGLVEQYVLLSAAEVLDTLAEGDAWSTTPGDAATVRRLEQLVGTTRALDAGAVLVSPLGQPLATWSPPGVDLPTPQDAGWAPLRATALSGKGTLPLSGVLAAGSERPLLAMGLPVALADGQRGLVLGLWDARASGLQQYAMELTYGKTGREYVVDAAGLVVVGPDVAGLGRPLPGRKLRAALTRGDRGARLRPHHLLRPDRQHRLDRADPAGPGRVRRRAAALEPAGPGRPRGAPAHRGHRPGGPAPQARGGARGRGPARRPHRSLQPSWLVRPGRP
jgi:hypothetical protein